MLVYLSLNFNNFLIIKFLLILNLLNIVNVLVIRSLVYKFNPIAILFSYPIIVYFYGRGYYTLPLFIRVNSSDNYFFPTLNIITLLLIISLILNNYKIKLVYRNHLIEPI